MTVTETTPVIVPEEASGAADAGFLQYRSAREELPGLRGGLGFERWFGSGYSKGKPEQR